MKVCPVCEGEWPDDTKFCPNDGSALRSGSTSRDLLGTLIADRYQIISKLGEGGMGAVYLAEHVKMGLKVAIKVLPEALAHDVGSVARFNREAKNAARIKHPNACAIHDFGETPDGLVYLAMEYVEGETLTQLLQREGAVSPPRAANILLQCCDALRSAHDLGIVHRDLKPDNIMVTKTRDGADFVKVVDFGIAKAVMDEGGQTLTQSGFLVGTPEYMSPEQVSGEVLDGRSDVYSLALVLFRMLTGNTPFKADTPQESFAKRLADKPLSLHEAAPGAEFPPGLQQLMDRALASSRDDRYPDVLEFGRATGALLQGMPDARLEVDVEAPTHLIPSGEDARLPTPETPQPAPPPAETEKRRSPLIVLAAVVVLIGGGIITTVLMRQGPEGEESEAASGTVSADSTARDTTAIQTVADDRSQVIERQQGQRPELVEIGEQIDAGLIRTALERLDQLRERDISDRAVNDLIAQAVRAEAEGLVREGDYDRAITGLSARIEDRPYLEMMEADLKELYLRRLAHALERDESVTTASVQLDEAFPRDAPLRYQATLLLLHSRYGSWAVSDFGAVLGIDPSYADSQPILDLLRAYLDSTWYSSTTHEAREIFGRYYADDHSRELLGNLASPRGDRRLNSYEILRSHAREDLAAADLFAFHVQNVTSTEDYGNQGMAFGSAIDYFLALNDEPRIREAIAALGTSSTNPHVSGASGLMADVADAIERLRSATIPIRVVHFGEEQTAPSRYRHEFQFDWMDESVEGATDYAARVSITLEIDGEVVADQSHLQPVTEFPQSRDCVRLGSTWRDAQQRPLPCSHGVLWRYLHVPLSPGEHNWTFSAAYTDGEDGQESFDERYSGIITTTVGIGPSQ